MIKNLKGFIMGFLASSLLIGSVTTAAVIKDVKITAILSNTIKFKFNGTDWMPKNTTTGEYYKPISYNGKVYMPVEAIGQALNTPVEYDKPKQIVWIGGKTEMVQINKAVYYEDYTGTILSTDNEKLSTPNNSFKWGITNEKDLDMDIFGGYFKPNGKYTHFRASFFLDDSAKGNLVITIRKNDNHGEALKSLTLEPGQTLDDVDIDISGLKKIYFETAVRSQGPVKKLIIGEPIFYNGTLQETPPTLR